MMLDDLRLHVAEVISAAPQATFLTTGPADLQAAIVRCEAHGLRLYALVPRMSDLLFNLEHRAEVLVIASQWQLRGTARVLAPAEHPAGLALLAAPEAAWCALVLVTPTRLHLAGDGATLTAETIDLLPYDDERVGNSR